MIKTGYRWQWFSLNSDTVVHDCYWQFFSRCHLDADGATLTLVMADQKIVVGYLAGGKSERITVEASSVSQHGEKGTTSWKITGDKGAMWVSGEAFIYAFPDAMFVKQV